MEKLIAGFSKGILSLVVLSLIVGWIIDTPLTAQASVVTDGLISYWTLDEADIQANTVKDVWGGQDATMQGDPQIVTGRVGDALEFVGDDWLLITDDINAAKLPTREMTAEAWAYPEEFDEWGTFISCFQDNGGFEKGWILGTVNNAEGAGPNEFSFAISSTGADDGDGDLIYFHPGPSDTGEWYHVVGVYDGSSTKLYINGELVLDSEEQSGDINYPANAFLTIGVYKDDNEHDPFTGKIDEVRLYEKALSEEEVKQNYQAKGMAVVRLTEKLATSWGEIKVSVTKVSR